MAEETLTRDRLILEYLTESDDWSGIVRKFNKSMDSIKAHGGGDKGKAGKLGFRGLPGATGIGLTGAKGSKGATIHFVQSSITNGQIVENEIHLEGDAIIDANGVFFSVALNNADNLVYIFEYSLAAAVSGSIVVTESTIVSQGTSQITSWYQRDTGDVKDSHAIFGERISAGATDEIGLYKVVIGDAKNPVIANTALAIVNIMPNGAVSAKDDTFHHLAFKYRSAPNTNVSSVTSTITYKELNKDELSPVGTDDVYWQFDNVSTGILFKHDTISTNDSMVVIRGKRTRFWGKTDFNQIYASGTLNNTKGYLDIDISDNNADLTARKNLHISATLGSVKLTSPTFFNVFATRTGFDNGVNVGGLGYWNAAVPVGGMSISGQVGIGRSKATIDGYTANLPSLKLAVNGTIHINNGSVVWNVHSTANVDHLWYDDVSNYFSFCADTSYKAQGNAGVKAGIFHAYNKIIAVNGLSVGTTTAAPAGGIRTTGSVTIGNQLDVTGAVTVTNTIAATGFINALDGNLYIGSSAHTVGDAMAHFLDKNSNTWRTLRWDDSVNDWRIEDGGGTNRVLWHSGNDGSGSGLDADKLDGINSTGFARINVRSSDGYAWIQATRTDFAMLVTQRGTGDIQRWYSGAGDGSYRAKIQNNGNFYTNGRVVCYDYLHVVNGNMYVGSSAASFTGDSQIQFGDGNSNTYRSIRWSNSANDWRVEDNGGTNRTLWHSGNLDAIKANADDQFSGKLSVKSTDGRQAGMYGIYNALRIGHVWSMGTAYKIHASGTNYGTLYGLAYKHTNNPTGGNMASGHQVSWVVNGVPRVSLGTHVWTSGALISVRAQGSIPIVVSSTTMCTKLNADYVDGLHGTAFARISAKSPIGTNTYLWVTRSSGSSASYFHQKSSGRITEWRNGNTTDGTVRAYVHNNGTMYATDFNVLSDARSKNIVSDHADDYLGKLSQLKIVNYNFKHDPDKGMIGLIAQEVEKILPHVINTDDDEVGTKSISLYSLIPYIIGAIQDLNLKIDKLS